jgi:hypothetical protein
MLDIICEYNGGLESNWPRFLSDFNMFVNA